MVGWVENLAMHLDMLPLVFTQMNPPGGIKGVFALDHVPFVFAQAVVVFGVDDGVFALSEGDAAEGVAEADAAIQNCQPNERMYEPIRDVEVNPDNFFPPGEIGI